MMKKVDLQRNLFFNVPRLRFIAKNNFSSAHWHDRDKLRMGWYFLYG